ncbi:MAG: glycosyl hydrolase family 28-related protein [Pirellulales bacterium]
MNRILSTTFTGLVLFAAASPAAETQVPPRQPSAPPTPTTGTAEAAIAGSRVDARAYGVRGDATTDDTAALQAALDAARTKGPVCFLAAGQYRINAALVVPPGVTLLGASGGTPHSEEPIGTVLLACGGRGNADGPPLVTLKSNAAIRNLTIHYPEQTLPEVTPYPWTIRGDGELCQVLDVTMSNPYQAIDFGTCWNELHVIRNVFACPLKTGVYIDQCTDIGRVENVHFNPNFWTRMKLKPGFPKNGDIKAYLENNLVGFKIGKTDWEYISNSFVIFPRVGFHFDDFGHGPGNAVITQSGADICTAAVRVDRTQPHAGVQFVNGQFMSAIHVGPQNQGPVKLTNCGFWPVPETAEQIVKQGPSTLVLNACHFAGWDSANRGVPCVRASGGRLIVSGCEFMTPGKQPIVLEKGLTAATVTGCLFRGERPVLDSSGGDVQVGLNATH